MDEIQLFVHYGLSFRSQFAMLSTTLFKQIRDGACTTKIPVLFMTASCTQEMFEQLQLLTGLRFYKDHRNIFWPSSGILMKRSIFTRVVYNTRPLTHFVSTMGQKILSNPGHRFVFYANSRSLIEKSSEKYGEWLDKSEDITSDYLKIVGTMKKEEKFHAMKLFCKPSTDAAPFNPQVLFATSGAANCGIDNENIYAVFRAEIPPSCEDMTQEEGRAGRRVGANPSTDSYTICISVESLIMLWRRMYVGTVENNNYRKSLLFDVDIMLACIVVPTHCIKSVLAHKNSNPFNHKANIPIYLPHPCLHSCSYCCGEYNDMFPSLIRNGVCSVLMDLFSGDNRISGDITFVPVLLDRIKKYPNVNRIIFGINSNKEPAPVMVKKMLLVLVSAKILRHTGTVGTKDTNNTDYTPVLITAALAHSQSSEVGGLLQYALFDDRYWHRVKLII